MDDDEPSAESPPTTWWTEFLGYSRLGFLGCAGLLAVVILLCVCFGVASAIMG